MAKFPRISDDQNMPEFSGACKVVCEKFKIKSFNHHQKQAFIALVGEKKYIFVNLPTGFGKSFIDPDWIFLHNGNGMPSSVQQTFVGRENGSNTKNSSKKAISKLNLICGHKMFLFRNPFL